MAALQCLEQEATGAEESDLVAADGRLVEANELRLDQSTLNGESRAVPRRAEAYAAALERAALPNIVFAGTIVVAGTGKALVFTTGMAIVPTSLNVRAAPSQSPQPPQPRVGAVRAVE